MNTPHPDELRKLTHHALKGHETQAALEKEGRKIRTVEIAINKADAAAAEAAKKGQREVIVYECEADKAPTFESLDEDTRDIFGRLAKYYEHKGYQTRIHGPYIGGGPSKPFNSGYDLYIMW